MAEYRAYIVGEGGHFISFRAYAWESDADATVWAKQLVEDHEIELWCGPRFVMRIGVEISRNAEAVSHEVIDGRMVPKK
jgi:hypothetical protein